MATQNPHTTPVLASAPATSNLLIKSSETDSTATNVVEMTLQVAKEVCELFKDVPYVESFSGILLYFIKIREEMQTDKDRCQELIDKILRRSRVILNRLREVGASANKAKLEDTKENLEEYNSLLEKIRDELSTMSRKGVRAKLGQFMNRKARIETIAKYDRLVDEFNTNLITDILLKLVNPSQPSGPASVIYKLIPHPDQMIGRDEDKFNVIETLLNDTLPRIAILGTGGLGKTTLALTVLCDPAVVERYPSRYFVSCEAITTLRGLILGIAHSLRIPDPEQDKNLIETVVSSFHGNSILCLDNFETTWEEEAIRQGIEEFLSNLHVLRQLAIIITMRGSQRPSRVTWSKPLLPPLARLSDANSRLIFEEADAPADEFTEKLLQAADGIPLAIKLMISQLQEDGETPELLWARWEQTQTRTIGTGGKHRLSSLDTSIHLSVYSPRMRADTNAISVFAMLASLLDGFPCRSDVVDELQMHLPRTLDLPEVLTILRRVSLMYVDGTGGRTRYRMLVPIREFGMGLQMEPSLDSCLIATYTKLLIRFSDYSNPAGYDIIHPELLNMHQLLLKALNKKQVDEKVVKASIHYTHWSRFFGNPTSELMVVAKVKTTEMLGLHARCISTLASVCWYQGRLDDAESSWREAIRLHQQASNVLYEAIDTWRLGDVYLQQNKLDEAEKFFTRAMELHQQTHSVRGRANCVQKLGDVYLRQDKLDKAEEFFTKAIELHRQTHSVRGEAGDIGRLGDAYLRRDELDKAEESFTRAMELHQQAHDVLGEANDLQRLGDLYLQQGKLNQAEESLTKAMELHKQCQSSANEAADMNLLKEVWKCRKV